MTARSRRWRRALGLLVGAGMILLLTGGSAQALPGIPDCKNPPDPMSAGSGVSGLVDPAPATPPAAADPFTAGSGTSIYRQYGYAGLRWSTYDRGCIGTYTDPAPDMDTLVGNWGLGMSVFLVSASNGLHSAVVDPSWLAPLDDVTASVTATVHDAIWTPWGSVGLLGVVVLLLLYSTRGQLSDVVRGAAWALLVLTVLAGVVNYPQRAGQFYDSAVIGTLRQLETSISSANGSAAAPSPTGQDGAAAQAPDTRAADTHAALLVDKVLYQAWLRGEFGSAKSKAATQWGPALFTAQALTYAEVAQADASAKARTTLTQAKTDAWKATAQQIQDGDPSAYANVQGKAGGRAAAGAMALFAASTTTLFRVVADLFLAAGLVMLRILVMFFPAVAVLGVILVFSGLVRRLGNAAGAAVVNVIAFGAASVLHTTIVTAALSRSDDGLSWMAIVLCLLVTVILFVLCLPLLSFTSLAGAGSGRRSWAGSALRGAGRLAGSYAISRAGRRSPAPSPTVESEGAGAGPTIVVVNLGSARQEEYAPAGEHSPDDDPAPRIWVTDRQPATSSSGPAVSVGPAAARPALTVGPRPAPSAPIPLGGRGSGSEAARSSISAVAFADDVLEGQIVTGGGRGGGVEDAYSGTAAAGVERGTGLPERRVAVGSAAARWHDSNLETSAGASQLVLWDPRTRSQIAETAVSDAEGTYAARLHSSPAESATPVREAW